MWDLLPSVCLNYDKLPKYQSFEYTWYENLHFTQWKYFEQKLKIQGCSWKMYKLQIFKKKTDLIVKCVWKDFNNFMCRFKTVLLRLTW